MPGVDEHTRDAGFTLIELLITLALLSLLTLTLFSSLRYGTRIWEASQSKTAMAENIRTAQVELARTISAAYPEFVRQDATHASILFDGQPHQLQVVAPDPAVKGAMSNTTIRTQSRSDDGDLVIERRLELSQMPGSRAPEVILSGIREVSFQYFGADEPGAKPVWADHWQGNMRPPLLVRIVAVLRDRTVTWPVMSVIPLIGGDVSCSLDAITNYCQGR